MIYEMLFLLTLHQNNLCFRERFRISFVNIPKHINKKLIKLFDQITNEKNKFFIRNKKFKKKKKMKLINSQRKI